MSVIFTLLNDVKSISDVSKMQQQCDARYWHSLAPRRLCQYILIPMLVSSPNKNCYNFASILGDVYTPFCIWKIRWWTNILDWNKRKKNLKKLCGTDRIHIKIQRVTKWARKRFHHDALLWDKEIPPSDQNNFVRNEALSSFWRNYSGPRMGFPCPITIHMKDTLSLSRWTF